MKELASTAVVLCGGKSRRMKFDKQCIQINKRLMAIYIADQLSGEFDEVIIVTNRPELYASYPYRVIMDQLIDFGPLGGIHAGLKASKSEQVYFIAGDMPYVNRPFIQWMKSTVMKSNVEILVAKDHKGRIEPFNGYYNRSMIGSIEKAYKEGHGKIIDLYDEFRVVYIKSSFVEIYSSTWRMYTNINEQADLNELCISFDVTFEEDRTIQPN